MYALLTRPILPADLSAEVRRRTNPCQLHIPRLEEDPTCQIFLTASLESSTHHGESSAGIASPAKSSASLNASAASPSPKRKKAGLNGKPKKKKKTKERERFQRKLLAQAHDAQIHALSSAIGLLELQLRFRPDRLEQFKGSSRVRLYERKVGKLRAGVGRLRDAGPFERSPSPGHEGPRAEEQLGRLVELADRLRFLRSSGVKAEQDDGADLSFASSSSSSVSHPPPGPRPPPSPSPSDASAIVWLDESWSDGSVSRESTPCLDLRGPGGPDQGRVFAISANDCLTHAPIKRGRVLTDDDPQEELLRTRCVSEAAVTTWSAGASRRTWPSDRPPPRPPSARASPSSSHARTKTASTPSPPATWRTSQSLPL